MEGDPGRVVREDHAGGDEQLGERVRLDAYLLVAGKVNARLLEELDGLGCVEVLTARIYIRRHERQRGTGDVLT